MKHTRPASLDRVGQETNTGGGDVTQPAPVTIIPDLNPDAPTPTVATITNDFPAPGVIVTKALAGGAADLIAGPYTIQLDCKLAGQEISGYPRDLTFSGPGSQEIRDQPIGALCTVDEPDTHGATSVTTAYDPDTNGTDVISGTTVGVASETNTYDPASLSVTKTVVGPGPAGPWTFTNTCHLTSNTGVTIPVTLGAGVTDSHQPIRVHGLKRTGVHRPNRLSRNDAPGRHRHQPQRPVRRRHRPGRPRRRPSVVQSAPPDLRAAPSTGTSEVLT